ncbi:MAG: hypothetical protein J5J00_12475 [Deltaproteobacteria bacterium]|nr:hypothetical protein [Deltaproteobacteria bacterium]
MHIPSLNRNQAVVPPTSNLPFASLDRSVRHGGCGFEPPTTSLPYNPIANLVEGLGKAIETLVTALTGFLSQLTGGGAPTDTSSSCSHSGGASLFGAVTPQSSHSSTFGTGLLKEITGIGKSIFGTLSGLMSSAGGGIGGLIGKGVSLVKSIF